MRAVLSLIQSRAKSHQQGATASATAAAVSGQGCFVAAPLLQPGRTDHRHSQCPPCPSPCQETTGVETPSDQRSLARTVHHQRDRLTADLPSLSTLALATVARGLGRELM